MLGVCPCCLFVFVFRQRVVLLFTCVLGGVLGYFCAFSGICFSFVCILLPCDVIGCLNRFIQWNWIFYIY